MKQINQYLSVLFAVLLIAGCEEEPFVEIDSVSAMGDEFFFNQKIKVWAAIKTDNLPAARYTWSCDGGRLTQPQSLDENTWLSPREPGIYNITCVVDVDGVKRSRTRQMFVSGLYFDKFERTPHTLTTNSSTASLVLDQTTGTSHLETRVTTITASRGYVQRAFDDAQLHAPFSIKAKLGWLSNFPVNPVTINSVTAQNTIYYEWTLNRDPDRLDNLYVDNIVFEWYPRGRTTPALANNGILRYRVRNVATNGTTTNTVNFNHPGLNFAQGELKQVSMSLDANYIFHFFVGGVEVATTDAIAQWRTTNGSQDDIYINQWRINYVSNTSQNASSAPPVIYIDDVVALDDGTVLQ